MNIARLYLKNDQSEKDLGMTQVVMPLPGTQEVLSSTLSTAPLQNRKPT
jgi:hypothetical protein